MSVGKTQTLLTTPVVVMIARKVIIEIRVVMVRIAIKVLLHQDSALNPKPYYCCTRTAVLEDHPHLCVGWTEATVAAGQVEDG